MKKLIFGFATGLLAGAFLAVEKEDELDMAMYKANRCKKKVMRQLHHMQNND